jgi:drug/metabolite transporter (DMT)-like permease
LYFSVENQAMIQRMQSIWLLLAAVCSFLTFRVSFYYGLKTGASINEALNATSGILLIICAAATGLGSFIAIFLYKDRKTQIRVTAITLILSLLSLVIYFSQTKNYTDGRFSLTAIVSIVIPVFLVLAIRGVWKDQKLVKSLDRLR